MKLGHGIIVELGGAAIALRPSLRDAMRLEDRPGGLRGLLDAVQEESLTAAMEIIGPHYQHPALAQYTFDALPSLTEPLTLYLLACVGIDPSAPPTTEKNKGETVPFAEHLAQLYRIGTGWLGWTPETTLTATPAEIIEARAGRLAMLQAIFSGPEKPKDTRPLGEKFKEAFALMGTVRQPSAINCTEASDAS